MRKYIFIFLLILSYPVYLLAAGVFGVDHPAKVFDVDAPDKVFGVEGLSSCEVFRSVSTYDYSNALGDQNVNYYRGAIIKADSHDICRVTAVLTKGAGDISGKSFYALIDTTSTNSLTLPARAVSEAVTGNNSWNASEVVFNFSPSVNVQSGDAIAVYMDGAADGSNYATIRMVTAGDADSGYSDYARWDNTGAIQTTNSGYEITGDFYD